MNMKRSNKHHSSSRGRASGVGFLLVAGLVGAGIYGLWHVRSGFKAPRGVFDTTAPTAEWIQAPKGVGAEAREFGLQIGDAGSGLQRVTVTAIQGEQRTQILEKNYEGDVVTHDELKVRVDSGALTLTEGTVELRASVEDHGMWSSPTEVVLSLPVDFRRGKIEPLTAQHNTSVGGAEVTAFRFVGRRLESGGVEVAGRLFKAFPLKEFDPSFSVGDDIYAVLFAVPTSFDPKVDTVKLVAVDDFGTQVSTSFYHRIAPQSYPEVEMKLSDSFVHSKVPELLASLRRAQPGVEVSGNDVRDFKLVNETLRGHNEETIQKALSTSPVSQKLWKGVFERPLAAAPKAGFSEKRVYRYEGSEVSRSTHIGVDLADFQQARVGAAQAGEVVFVGELGIYGETVIIDHGVGVSSLYGHLSSISVKLGDRVSLAQEIGRTGISGLAGGDHLHFEIRVQGVPVSPFAWWDPNWMRDHVEGKITEVEKMLLASTAASAGGKR
jgi:murein DD-endopeptidase MepM/ murein hydrolase activator NlpD